MKKIFYPLLTLCLFFIIGSAVARTVNEGDTLCGIASQVGITCRDIIELNKQIPNPDLIYPGDEINVGEELLGGTNPVAGMTYTLSGSGVTASATSITLQSLTIPQTGYELVDADFSSTFYVTLEPGNTKRQEIISCTTVTQGAGTTATLSGCVRGLTPFTPYTADSDYAFSHAGGTSVIFSDAPQLFNEYPAKGNNETITGTWTYNTRPQYQADTDTTNATDFITLGQLSRQAISGASNSSEAVKGIVELATGTEAASSTSSGTTGARLVLPASLATSSPYTTGLKIPVTQNNGKLSQSFLDLTQNYTWSSGNQVFNNGFVSQASSTFTGVNTVVGTLSVSATSTMSGRLIGDTTNIVSATASTTFAGSTTPQPAYFATSTGALLLSDANDDTTYYQFNGFVISSGTNGQSVYLQTGGIVSGFTGLTTGAEYYVQDAVGTIGTTQGTTPFKVGIAVSTTQLLIQREKKLGTLTNTSTSGSTYSAYTDKYVYGYSTGGTDDKGSCTASIDGTLVNNSTNVATGSHLGVTIFVSKGHTYSMTCTGGAGNTVVIYHQNYN